MLRAATITEDGLYRYRLTRAWDYHAPQIAYVMLNPSTADAEIDDQTIKRCVFYAQREGFGSLAVVNLFAWRATHPIELRTMPVEKVGEHNDRYIRDVVDRAGAVVAAWGAVAKPLAWRERNVRRMLPRDALCLGFTKHGAPRHPCRLADATPLVPLFGGAA